MDAPALRAESWAASHAEPHNKQGFLMCKERSWKPRFFVLKGTSLYGFKDNKKNSKPQLFVNLAGCVVDCAPDDTKAKMMCCFSISRSNETVLYLSATTEDEMVSWIKALIQAVAMALTMPMSSSSSSLLSLGSLPGQSFGTVSDSAVSLQSQSPSRLKWISQALKSTGRKDSATKLLLRFGDTRHLPHVIRIQAHFRMHKERVRYLKTLRCATRMQARIRAKRAAKQFQFLRDKNKKRKCVVEEILTTERNYVEVLKAIVQVFMVPLLEKYQKSKGKAAITAESIRHIFSNVAEICDIHQIFFAQLEQTMSNGWFPHLKIAALFLPLTEGLKMYTRYVNNYDTSIKTLQNCLLDPNFKSFVTEAEQNPRCFALDVSSLLINPIQRIPRYILLLKDLQKHTWPEHSDYRDLVEAVLRIQAVADYINEAKRDSESLQKLLTIQTKLTDKKLQRNLIQPHRKYLREGVLIEVLSNGQEKERYVFLFNDLLITSKKTTVKKSVFNSTVRFNNKDALYLQMVTSVGKVGGADFLGFQIVTRASSITIWKAQTESERDGWIRDIQKQIHSLQTTGPSQSN